MAKMPDENLQDFISRRQQERQETTNKTVAQQLDKKLKLNLKEPTITKVNKTLSGIGVATCSEYEGTPLSDCLNRLTKTEVWDILNDLKISMPDRPLVSVVFKTKSDGKKWALHTWTQPTVNSIDRAIIRRIRGDLHITQPFMEFCDFLREELGID